jgi:undecaprenyl-diphosphatase
LWVVVVVALVGWSAVMWIAERVGKRDRPESSLNLKDAVIIGLVQCVALIPGVSRSVATISARRCGIWTGPRQRGWRSFSPFRLCLPPGRTRRSRKPTVLATEVSFVVGYASIAWLLRFVAKHSITVFIWYRVALAAVIAVLLGTGMLSPT